MIESGDPKRALAKLQPVFRAEPKSVETLELLALAFLGLNASQKSEAVSAIVQGSDPARANGYTQRADELEELRQLANGEL